MRHLQGRFWFQPQTVPRTDWESPREGRGRSRCLAQQRENSGREEMRVAGSGELADPRLPLLHSSTDSHLVRSSTRTLLNQRLPKERNGMAGVFESLRLSCQRQTPAPSALFSSRCVLREPFWTLVDVICPFSPQRRELRIPDLKSPDEDHAQSTVRSSECQRPRGSPLPMKPWLNVLVKSQTGPFGKAGNLQ